MSNRPSTIKKEEKSPSIENQSISDSSSANGVRRFFSIPSPIRILFDKVPIIVYPPNDLPQRAQRSARIASLYVFSTEKDAAAGRPSFNPSCLKWQVRSCDSLLHSYTTNVAPDFPQHRWRRSPLDSLQQPCISLWSASLLTSCNVYHGVTSSGRLEQVYQICERARRCRGRIAKFKIRGISIATRSQDTQCLGECVRMFAWN